MDFPACHIQYQLVSAADGMPSGDFHGPVGVGAEQVGILGYHLRLEPDAEFHAQIVDLPYQLRQAAFDLFLIDIPVSEARIIIVTLSEPAVIHDDHLDAHIFGCFGYIDQLFIIKVEKRSFPGIDQDRASDIPYEFAPVEISAEEMMEVVAHSGQSLMGIGHKDGRRVKGLARFNRKAEQAVVDAHDKPCLIVLVQFRFHEKAPRIHQGEAIAGTEFFISRAVHEGCKRILLVGGDAAAAADLVHMMGQGLTLDLTFLTVSSGEGDQIHIAPVHKIHIDGHNTLEVDPVAAVVVDTGRPHNDI